MPQLFLSIVIPAYNAASFIDSLMDSIVHSKRVPWHQTELLVVDDHSKDKTVAAVQKFFLKSTGKKIPVSVKIIALKRNKGPAHARNVGVRYASGTVVLFFDADVVARLHTIAEVIRSFQNDPDLFALTGVWEKHQRTRAFFPRFKAIRDWSYWINERDPRTYYYLFSTRVAAINRGLFLRLGGFDETYKAALVEDIDLTYRIARRYAVVFNPRVIVHHEFEDFTTVAKKYFLRSYYWSKIYRTRKRFDPVATTAKEAVTTVSAGGVVVFGIWYGVCSILEKYFPILSDSKYYILYTLYILLVVHLWGVRKFLWFCVKEEGMWFALRAFVVGFVLYLVILAGALVSWIK